MGTTPNTITIVTVCDNHFTVLLAALIKSIEINHHTEEIINFYIVGDKLNTKNKRDLAKCVKPDKFSFFWLEMNEIIQDKRMLPFDNSSFPVNVYIRLFIPLFLPAHIDKVLYLDVDMIVRKDISLLWNTDLGEKIVAGVLDRSQKVSSPWGGIQNYAELGLDPETKYFNSGLLLINRNQWLQFNATEKIISCISHNKKYTSFPDQYGLNAVLANQWLELDSRWNNYSMLEEQDPFIIHFIEAKPIYTSYHYNQQYREEFYNYLKQTPWINYKPQRAYIRLLRKLWNKGTKIAYRFIRK